MLWHKSWMEVRMRFLLSVGLGLYIGYLVLGVVPGELQAKFQTLSQGEIAIRFWKIFVIAFGGAILPVCAKILAGAGINSQTSMGMSRGFHGSMGFLLSMPVSREQILVTRAGLGLILLLLLGTAVFTGVVILAPVVSLDLSGIPVWQSLPNIFAVSLFFYSMAVWFYTFLDEFWAGTIGLLLLGSLGGVSVALQGTIFDFGAYLMSDSALLPLGQTILLILLSAAQLMAARWVVLHKEY